MALYLGIATFAGIFILFLVLSKALNNSVNQLVKITKLLQKEFDLKKERFAIAALMDEEKNKPDSDQEDEESDTVAEPSSGPGFKKQNNKK